MRIEALRGWLSTADCYHRSGHQSLNCLTVLSKPSFRVLRLLKNEASWTTETTAIALCTSIQQDAVATGELFEAQTRLTSTIELTVLSQFCVALSKLLPGILTLSIDDETKDGLAQHFLEIFQFV
jgi:hypothetical protein